MYNESLDVGIIKKLKFFFYIYIHLGGFKGRFLYKNRRKTLLEQVALTHRVSVTVHL